ncbi:hypothetical protein C7U60_15815 [Mesorhizobium plurifarium]|uniref:hypothetical protein n=1 Tax=Sinorhizobium arboris TaxID=76745 RepID=UPI000415C197|nr:hypothetical protein [Sinorhizobium arboris]PST20655.1 hypothetical protein C7U60_15815 [Mesorhizobium plurifarium]
MTRHYIRMICASLAILISTGPALAGGDYYSGADVNAKRRAPSLEQNIDESRTGGLRPNAAAYGFPVHSEPPAIAKGGEGEYYPGVSRR